MHIFETLFAVMVDLEKIIESTEFMTTVGSWMAHSWNIDEAESYLASIKSELEDLTDRAHATAGMCTPEIRAYLGNFDQNARTKFASSYKRIDNIVRELERDVDAEIARCEKRADEWTEQARDDLSRGRSSQFSTENAEEYRNKATEVRKRSQRAMNAMQSLLRAVNACADALFTKV